MLRSRFLWQVWGILGFTLVISTLVFGIFVADQVERDALDRIEASLQAQARALTPTLAAYLDEDELLSPDDLTSLVPGISARITLIDASGKVLADNNTHPGEMDNHASRPEVLDAIRAGQGVSIRHSDTLGLSMLYMALQVESVSGRQGFLRLSLPLTSIDEQLAAVRIRILVSAATVGLLFLVIGYLLALRVTNPIVRMTETAREIARGEYQLRLPADRQDEIGQLGAVVNELALGAQQRIDELTSNRNRLAAILAALTEGVVALDMKQQIVHINERAIRMLKLKEDSFGKQFNEIATAREIRQAVETCISEQTSVECSVSFAGRTLQCSCALMAGIAEDGAGAILIVDDVTERLRLEKVRSDFVANASHELKTPISAIRGLIETIIDDPEMPEDVFARFAERIRQQAIGLDRIVQDLLDLSRFDRESRPGLVRVDLNKLASEVYRSKSDDADDAGLDFHIDLPDETVAILGESEAISQLITNLVDNALKYTGEGGRVTLRLNRKGSIAEIEVEDTGIGISRDEIQRIFERFYRVDKARSRDVGGTGLGLSIVKHIAQAHNGDVSVTSQLEKGSVFRVQIPIAETV